MLSMDITSFMILKFAELSVASDKEYEAVYTSVMVGGRCSFLFFGFSMAIGQGFTPPSSYAFGNKKPDRWKKTSFFIAYLEFSRGILVNLTVIIFNKEIARLFSKILFFNFRTCNPPKSVYPLCFYTRAYTCDFDSSIPSAWCSSNNIFVFMSILLNDCFYCDFMEDFSN